ncbi:siderophore-interacting protein [Allonocardiopsis opalescens]|uniref:NADPH-dependent ferric siderophore reductase n=1 Tax=Allonocardiopsis opalescens TaxID=1144618 RepID=A0A2T0Q1N0_9ACTN|nr:siderophore-interacting protein [Allonocardiopsis opalescens]PRX97704.1 NADPH-dependent ferric siderophore reductase [Allonocardiopsis opalescens]
MESIRAAIRRLTREHTPITCTVTVDSIDRVSDGFVRIGLRGPALADYRVPRPADAFKIALPPDRGGAVEFPERGPDRLPYWREGARPPVFRAFTVRRHQPERARVEFDAAVHPTGAVSRWLGTAAVGDTIGLGGMRREFHEAEVVDRHLVIGDSSALPAVAAIVESLSGRVPARVYLAADHDSDRALVPRREHVRVHWVEGGSPTGDGSALERAVLGETGRGERIQLWLAGEAGVVRRLRGFALDTLGVARDDMHAAAYWKDGTSGTEADAAQLLRYREQVAAGGDAADPDVREAVELGV